jgi:[ribosomal protein S18]-alanine N-acetyltransferase
MLELERSTPRAAHWPRSHYENLFATNVQGHAERIAWVVQGDSEPVSTPSNESQVLGFLVAHRVDSEWELENIVVAAVKRRKGLGTMLLHKLINDARTTCATEIFLEVRESNLAARRLYEKHGFEEAGLRKNYYASPSENAVLYRLNVS